MDADNLSELQTAALYVVESLIDAGAILTVEEAVDAVKRVSRAAQES